MTARVVVAGTHSGVGKTTVATGLMAAFAGHGRRVAGFKVGPDFIDPSYHAVATGRPGRNLDAFLSGTEMIAPLFVHGAAGADMAIVEGVMGMFDGAAGAGGLLRGGAVGRRGRPRLRQLRPRRRRRGADPQPGRLRPARGVAARGARPARRARARRAAPPGGAGHARAAPRPRSRRRTAIGRPPDRDRAGGRAHRGVRPSRRGGDRRRRTAPSHLSLESPVG